MPDYNSIWIEACSCTKWCLSWNRVVFDAFCSLLHEHYTQRMTHNKAHTSSFNVTGWTARGSNPGGGEIFRTRPDRPWGPPSLLYNGYRVFPGGKAAGAWCWSPTPSRAEIKERVELNIYLPFGPLWHVLGWTLPLPLPVRLIASLAVAWGYGFYSQLEIGVSPMLAL